MRAREILQRQIESELRHVHKARIRAVFAAGAKKMASDGQTPVQVEDKSSNADSSVDGKMNEF